MSQDNASPRRRDERTPLITPRPGVVVADRYAIVRRLASGGMGTVWVARDRALEIDVAMKFMAPELASSSEARGRFEREARAAAGLRSQHVVQILDYGVEGDTPYMAMELLQGRVSPRASIARGGSRSRAATPIITQIEKALRTAHKAGFVHRDLKPGNIFLALKDEDEVAKVLDFGIVKTAGPAETHTTPGAILGSIQYMSPEQIRCPKSVDLRSDLWSLGVVVYRAIAGYFPFPGTSSIEILAWACDERGPLPPRVAPDLPVQLDAFFARALAREADARFQSARELLEAFCAAARQPPPAPSSYPAPRRSPTVQARPALAPPLPETAAGTRGDADEPTWMMPKPAPLAALYQDQGSGRARPLPPSVADSPTVACATVPNLATLPTVLAPCTEVERAPWRERRKRRPGPGICSLSVHACRCGSWW